MVSVAKSFDAPIKVSFYVRLNSLFCHLHFFQITAASSIHPYITPFCLASISHCGCCTPVLNAWSWWYRNTWSVINMFSSFVPYSSAIYSDTGFSSLVSYYCQLHYSDSSGSNWRFMAITASLTVIATGLLLI
jgi:hypothetical protein